MSTHLGETINAVQNVFQTDNDDILDFRYPIRVQIDSEQMDVSGAGFVGSEAIRWSVTRGVAGTAKASHAVGTAITAVDASSGGGGGAGVSVTDGTTTVAATSLSLPSGMVTDQGGGSASVQVVAARVSLTPVSKTANTHFEVNPAAFGSVAFDAGFNTDAVAADHFVTPVAGLYRVYLAGRIAFGADPGAFHFEVGIWTDGDDPQPIRFFDGITTDAMTGSFAFELECSTLCRLEADAQVGAQFEADTTNSVTADIGQTTGQEFSIELVASGYIPNPA